jgi:hypothetical protein
VSFLKSFSVEQLVRNLNHGTGAAFLYGSSSPPIQSLLYCINDNSCSVLYTVLTTTLFLRLKIQNFKKGTNFEFPKRKTTSYTYLLIHKSTYLKFCWLRKSNICKGNSGHWFKWICLVFIMLIWLKCAGKGHLHMYTAKYCAHM